MMTTHRPAVLLVVLMLLGAACASTLAESAPFPCADDGTCPDGFSCLPGIGCKQGAARDKACSLRGSGCAEGECVGAVCLLQCNAGAGVCDPGRVCSYPPPGESAALARCVADCTTVGCPEGLECQALFNDKKGCVSPSSKAGIDKPCNAPEDCQTQYGLTFLPITCSRGTCVPLCSMTPAVTCGDPARTCFIAEPITSGCLLDCTATGTCPQGLTCKDTPNSTVRMCTASAGDGGGMGGGTGGGTGGK